MSEQVEKIKKVQKEMIKKPKLNAKEIEVNEMLEKLEQLSAHLDSQVNYYSKVKQCQQYDILYIPQMGKMKNSIVREIELISKSPKEGLSKTINWYRKFLEI